MRRWVSGVLGTALVLAGGTLASPPALAASAVSGVVATVQGLNAAVTWQPGDVGGVTGYHVTAAPALAAVDVPAGADSAVLTGLQPGVSYTVSVTTETAAGPAGTALGAQAVKAAAPGGTFTALAATPLLDTRTGLGVPRRATASVTLRATGRAGVPAAGVQAVLLDVTVAGPAAGGQLTAYPAGAARPQAVSAAYPARLTTTQLVVARVGTQGRIVLAATGKVELAAAVVGYWSTAAAASLAAVSAKGLFNPVPAARLADTRTGAGGTATLQVAGHGGVPATGASAVVLDVTAVSPTAAGYVTACPTGARRPGVPSLSFGRGQSVVERVVVPLGSQGRVSLYNRAGGVRLLVDVDGWYTDGSSARAGGSYFVALTPQRLLAARVAGGGVLTVPVAGRAGVPAAGQAMPPTAAALTVTLDAGPGGSAGTVSASRAAGASLPDLSAPAGKTASAFATSGVGVDGAVLLRNSGGSGGYAVDVAGYFVGGVDTPSSTVALPGGAISSVTGTPGTGQSVVLAAGHTAPAIGQVISSGVTPATPAGLLVQVTGQSTDAQGQTVVQTRPTTLQEALGTADFTVTAPLGSTQSAGPAGTRTPAAAGAPVSGGSSNPCSADATSHVDVTHDITPTLYFHAQLGHRGLVPTVDARTGVSVSETLGVSVQYSGQASCTWDKQLYQHEFGPIEFAVGDVPVVIVPVFTLKLHASVSGTTSLSASVTQNVTADAGLSYDSTTDRATPYATVPSPSATPARPSIPAAWRRTSASPATWKGVSTESPVPTRPWSRTSRAPRTRLSRPGGSSGSASTPMRRCG